MTIYQVTPFLNGLTVFQSCCSFRVRCFTAIKKASKFFLLWLFIGADIKSFHWEIWSGCWKRFLVGSESLFRFSCSLQRVTTYVIFLTRSDSLIHFTWRVWIFLLQRGNLSDFLRFPNNSKIILFFGENLQFF